MFSYSKSILDIDLTEERIKENKLDEKIARLLLGGKGLAAYYLYKRMKKGVLPFHEENILAIFTGPLTGTSAPGSSKFIIETKSPLTNTILCTNCGGNFGIKLKKAGYDGIIIKGKAKEPTYIHIENESIELKPAQSLWSLNTMDVQKSFSQEYGILTIGPAGENMVLYASVVSQDRVAGRGGAGAIMGSKNLKAIVVNGNKKIEIAEEEKFKKSVDKAIYILKNHSTTAEALPRYGTANLMNIVNAYGALSTKNHQMGRFDKAEDISGESIQKYVKRRGGCSTCIIRCGRYVKVGDRKEEKCPEFETLALMGANLLIHNLEEIFEWNSICDSVGIDTISTGNVLAYAMELFENGKSEVFNKTEPGWIINFSSPNGIKETLYKIARREGIGNILADGVKRMGEVCNDNGALHVKGLDIPAYDPRQCVGQGLGYATSNRGACHLSGGTSTVELMSPPLLNNLSIKGKAEFTYFLQNLYDAVNCSVLCLFDSYAMAQKPGLPHWLMRTMINKFPGISTKTVRLSAFTNILTHALGYEVTREDWLRIGERAFTIERLFNVREGFNSTHDTLPERFNAIPLSTMLSQYYKLRLWDENGIPRGELLRKLNISDIL